MKSVYQIEANDNTQDAVSVVPRSGLSFIEQLQIVSIKQCSKDNRPYLNGVNESAHTAILTRPACKMWNCEACGARNAKLWIARVINGVNKLGGEWFFLTITSHKKMRGLKSIKSLREGWKKFYNRMLAENGKTADGIFYCKVWEQHKDGGFHLHILINMTLGTRWAKDNAAETGMGFQADWHQVDNAGQVAGYISKYSLKNATMARGGIEWPKGLRRVEVSRKWPILPKLKASEGIDWYLKMTREAQLLSANAYHLRGFDILDMVKEKKED